MPHPMKYMPLPETILIRMLKMCECGAVILNEQMHSAYHSQNDREMY